MQQEKQLKFLLSIYGQKKKKHVFKESFGRLRSELVMYVEQYDALILGNIGLTDKARCSEDSPKSMKTKSNWKIKKKFNSKT